MGKHHQKNTPSFNQMHRAFYDSSYHSRDSEKYSRNRNDEYSRNSVYGGGSSC